MHGEMMALGQQSILRERGALEAALPQITMAIASDPQSAEILTALSEVDTEVRKGP